MLRRFAKTILALGLIGFALFLYALMIEPRRLVVRSLNIGEGAQSVRIVVLSDLHAGGLHVNEKRVQRIVERVNQLQPDLTLMPGDFINGHDRYEVRSFEETLKINDAVMALTGLQSTTFATIGNHDNWYGGHIVTQLLEAAGLSVLNNQAEAFNEFCIVGLADDTTDTPNRDAFDTCAEGAIILALMHSPDGRDLLRGDTALAVAGHTHGGQVNLPFVGRAVTATQCGARCAYGLIQTDPPLYVTSGIGTSILPIRFRAVPEIALITLRYDRLSEGAAETG